MRHRLSVRLSDELAEGIEARVMRTGQSKSDVVRESLKLAGVRVVRRDPARMTELLERAAALQSTQPNPTDAVALLREVRGDSLQLRLYRLTVPFMSNDLA